jgi:two-component system, NarL family, sensor histidine kinase UhpB
MSANGHTRGVELRCEGSSDTECTSEREFEERLQRRIMDEVRHLAAELHDGVGQDLAGISLMLSAMRRLPQAQHVDIQKPLEDICSLMVHAMVNCRRVAEGFGGFLVSQQGLTAALAHFASQFDGEATPVVFHGEDIPTHWLDETTAYYLFGIGREAIFNAFRHSRAKAIRVTCDHTDNTIRLIVEDDGIGPIDTASRDRGIGRTIMEFRARSIGAELTFTAVPSGGLRVECIFAFERDDI